MYNSEQNVAECDATGFHSSIEAGFIIKKFKLNTVAI